MGRTKSFAVGLLLITASAIRAEDGKYAVVVGVGRYPDSSGLGALRYPTNDALGVASALRSLGYSVKQLLNEQATSGAIERELANLPSLNGVPESTIVFYFSGHGFELGDREKPEPYFATYDSIKPDGSGLKVRGLPFSEISALLDRVGASNQVAFIDACRTQTDSTQEAVAFSDSRLLKGQAVLLSAKSNQESIQTLKLGGGRGAFSYYLEQALRGGASSSDGEVNLYAVANFVSREVERFAKSEKRIQSPALVAGSESRNFRIGTLSARPSSMTSFRIVEDSEFPYCRATYAPMFSNDSAIPAKTTIQEYRSEKCTFYLVNRPAVHVSLQELRELRLGTYDRVLISAGGCVNVGGQGLTWRKYVRAPQPTRTLYSGLIQIPGLHDRPVPIATVLNRPLIIPPLEDRSSIKLGYVDDYLDDNGFYSPDDGINGECRGQGDAFLVFTVQNRPLDEDFVLSKDEEGFRFDLKGCYVQKQAVRCNLKVTNLLDANRCYTIRAAGCGGICRNSASPSVIRDDADNEYTLAKVRRGNAVSSGEFDMSFSPRESSSLVLEFQVGNRDIEMIKQLQIGSNLCDWTGFRPVFDRVPVLRPTQ